MTGAPIAAAAAIVAAAALALLDWRRLFLVSIVAMTFQGLLSVALPDQQWTLLLADGAVVLTVVKFGFWALKNAERPPIGFGVLGPWVLLCLWAGAQAMNSAIPNPLMALIGLRTLLLYPPLLWVTFAYIRNWNDLRRWMLTVVGLACLSSLVAAFEYLRGAEWYASLGPGFRAATYQVGGFSGQFVFRANGTFSAAGHFAALLTPSILLTLAMLVASRTWGRGLAASLALMLLTAGLFANNQRATTVVVLVGILAIIAVALRRYPVTALVLVPTIGIAAVGVAWQVAGAGFLDRVLSFATDPSDVIITDHLVLPVQESLGIAIRSTVFGHGTGTATAGARHLGPIWEHSEQFAAGLWYELGVIGFVAFFAGLTVLLWKLLRAWSATRDSRTKVLATAIVVYVLGTVTMSGTYAWLQYPPTMILFWSMIGLGLRLPRLQPGDDVRSVPPNRRHGVGIRTGGLQS